MKKEIELDLLSITETAELAPEALNYDSYYHDNISVSEPEQAYDTNLKQLISPYL